jgi:hypothetical protein
MGNDLLSLSECVKVENYVTGKMESKLGISFEAQGQQD